jgi:hypothetical protein
LYIIKIGYQTANNLFLHVLQSLKLIMLESEFFILYIVFLAIKAFNIAVISLFVPVKGSLPNQSDQILLALL